MQDETIEELDWKTLVRKCKSELITIDHLLACTKKEGLVEMTQYANKVIHK